MSDSNLEAPDSNPFLSPADRELESALAGLTPALVKLDERDAWFEAGRQVGESAGRRSGQRQLLVWRVAAALVLTIGSAAALSRALQPRSVAKFVEQNKTPEQAVHSQNALNLAPDPPSLPRSVESAESRFSATAQEDKQRTDWFTLRQLALEKGVDALPTAMRSRISCPRAFGDDSP